MNDDDTNIEPVDLSPTRAELIARVRARGRRIRARRRLAITGLTALVVLAIAVPAVAISARPSSHGVAPATGTHRKGDLRIAVVVNTSSPPCAPGTLPYNPPVAATQHPESACLQLGAQIVSAADVRDVSVAHDDTLGWFLDIEMSRAAVTRLAAQANRQVAFIVNDHVVSAPVVNPGITGTTVTVSPLMTREQAIAIATEILGHAPAHVEAAPTITASIELSSKTIVSGASASVTLVIVNHTHHAVALTDRVGCPIQWRATLTPVNGPVTATLGARVSASTCPTASPIEPGANRIQVTVSTVLFCHSPAGSLTGVPACLANGEGPPLTAGDYELQVSGNSTDAPLPAPVRVEVVAAAR